MTSDASVAAVHAWMGLSLGAQVRLLTCGRRLLTTVGGGPGLLFLLLLSGYSLQTHRYLRVWQNDVTLWYHAARRAPLKPRPWNNLAQALMNAKPRHDQEAAQVLDYVEGLLKQPHLTDWDRREAVGSLKQNRGDLVRRPPE